MRILQVIMALCGGLIGFRGALYLVEGAVWPPVSGLHPLVVMAAAVVVGALVFVLSTKYVVAGLRKLTAVIIASLQRIPALDIAAGAVGLIAGMIIGILATLPLPRNIPIIGGYLPIAVTLTVGYIGAAVAVRKKEDLLYICAPGAKAGPGDRQGKERGSGRTGKYNCPKILDTSVIIDGRIADIVQAGFLEGPLVVPGFVLAELQHIADSGDILKRNRGRRGLDILNRIQKDLKIPVQIIDRHFDEVAEVDAKLVKLARLLEGKVVTNDYNLNKVAELQGVSVLNINELVNAVKPVVLPGEEMTVRVVKDGKEHGQGVGYLDDGTMIVIDGGRRYIGESVGVQVTNVLQTAAGRMIFAKPKVMERAL